MTQKIFFRLTFFLLNFISIYNSKIIVFPFRTNSTENFNITQKFFDKYLYTENLIGTPSQTININIFQDEYDFYLGENTCNKIPATYYNPSESSTYIPRSDLVDDAYYGAGYLSEEFFSFYNSTNLKSNITTSNLSFFFLKHSKGNEKQKVCGVIGFRLEPSYFDYDYTTSFIDAIRHLNLVDFHYWSYIFFEKDKNNKIKNVPEISNEYIMKNYEGLLILGNTPHEYDSNQFNESDLLNVHASKIYLELCWDLVFKDIFFLQKNGSIFHLNQTLQTELDISLNYVLAPVSIFQNITEYFFRDYLNNNICKFNKFTYDYNDYTFISCNKKNFNKDDIKKFPTIYFEHLNYNYTFNLSYYDLFEEFNNDILFLIYSRESLTEIWKLGKIFLKKYKFIFHQEYETIGFYRNYYRGNEKDDYIKIDENSIGFLNNKNFWITLCWISACIVCLGIGIKIGSIYIMKMKKKRANELKDDDYEYSIQNEIN